MSKVKGTCYTEVDEFTRVMNLTWFSLDELNQLSIIKQGHFDNLMLEPFGTRVWLSRMTVADGMEYDNQVTIEYFNEDTRKWCDLIKYEAVNMPDFSVA